MSDVKKHIDFCLACHFDKLSSPPIHNTTLVFMTYLQFHLYFSLPLLLVTAWLARGRFSRVHARWLGLVCVIVFVFTTPWDNHAVKLGIWDFPEDKILFRIWRLPIEEYGFFLLQTISVGLLTVALLRPRSSSTATGKAA
jgi:putative membrane protein